MKHIVSFSGGKDSTAMLLKMVELDYQIDDIVFADTGFEFPEMYDHIQKVEKYIGRKITVLKTDEIFEDWLFGNITRGKHKGMQRGFPLMLFGCWWMRESKLKVLDKYIGTNYRYLGIAYDEKKRLKEKEGYIYPLADLKMTEKDCIQYLISKNMYSPILGTFKRTGCWWCPKQGIKSLETLYNNYPHLWNQLKLWQSQLERSYKLGYELEELEEKFTENNMQLKLDLGDD